MMPKLSHNTRRAMIVAGRFGFISRENYWKHVSRRQKSENYASWKKLTASGLFKPYSRAPEYLFLSSTGVLALRELDEIFVGKAHPIYLEHDEILMSVALACENAGLILSNWVCDSIIRKMRNSDKVRLLGAATEKIPDLAMDLNLLGTRVRVAVEVERTRKSSARYDALVLSYMEMRSVELVVIAYNDPHTEAQIRHSMKRLGYPESIRPVAFCKITDLKESPSSFPIRLNGNVIAFDKFISNLRRLKEKELSRIKDGPEYQQEIVPGNFPARNGGHDVLK